MRTTENSEISESIRKNNKEINTEETEDAKDAEGFNKKTVVTKKTLNVIT